MLNPSMQLFTTPAPLIWGSLDLPLMGVSTDWVGNPLNPPVGFTVATDPESLWFLATRGAPAKSFAGTSSHGFHEKLWQADTAELFIGDPTSGRYLEINLAPNAAWWACLFREPRVTCEIQPDFTSKAKTYLDDQGEAGWLAAICFPLTFLRETLNFGPGSTGNAAFILNSPDQTFHSATKLPGSHPDFHQPAKFPLLIPVPVAGL